MNENTEPQELIEAQENLGKAYGHYHKERRQFIEVLSRPASAIDYLFGQCLAAATARDIWETDRARREDYDMRDARLVEDAVLIENAAELLDELLAQHSQCPKSLSDSHYQLDEARDHLRAVQRETKKKKQ